MPSAHSQNHFIMEKQKTLNSVASAQPGGESSTFICAECGDGFSQYSSVLTHMVIHGPLESFSFDGSSNGFEVPREYVLQENGTLTVVNGLVQSHHLNSSPSNVKPVSPGALPSHFPPPSKPVPPSPALYSSPYKDSFKPRQSDSILDKSRQGYCRCEICNRSFNSLQSLHRHQQYRNTERGYKCTLCCKIVEDRLDLKKHLQSHISERFHCCGSCGKRFLKVDALNAHQKESHFSSKTFGKPDKQEKKCEKSYTCKKCQISFFWMSDFQTHSLYQCKGKELSSSFGSEIGVNSKILERIQPIKSHSNGTSINIKNGHRMILKDTSCEIDSLPTFTPYRCGLCGDRFDKLTALKEHHVTHQTQEEIDQLNQESQKAFKRRVPPKSRRRRGSNPNGKLHPCKHCHRVFNHSSSLSRHMRYHKGTMHACTFCGRHYPQRCDLRRHLALYHKTELEKKPGLIYLYTTSQYGPSPSIVDEEKNTSSPDENTRGSSDNELSSTEQSPKDKQSGNTGRGNYKCQECGKKFGFRCLYQRHLRYHKKKTHKCPQCPALFKNSWSLHLHLQNHPSLEQVDDGQRSSVNAAVKDQSLKE
ncbi:uncharacterized protein ACNS7B_019452 [Menidia menidia]